MNQALLAEKHLQARDLCAAHGLDVWLIFVRETAEGGDPILPFLMEGCLTWVSALLITPTTSTAIVGNFDADALRESGAWTEVIPYVQDIKPTLLSWLEDHVSPEGKIGLNFSTSDCKADGLTHGMKLLLDDILAGSAWSDNLVSAARVASSLRGIKSHEEVERMRRAIEHTRELFDLFELTVQERPTEREAYTAIHTEMARRDLGFAWDQAQNPIVNFGPNSMIGHGTPSSTLRPEPGQIIHIDLGVTCDHYSSDIQNCWFATTDPYEQIPADVQEAFDAVTGAITAAADMLRPGLPGHQIDAAARRYLMNLGHEEYLHATGHQVGRKAHDGGAIIGPRWARYGETPDLEIQEGEVYTLELGVMIDGRGYLGIEEMILVGPDGPEFLTERQLTLPVLVLR
jgi:Xaa-Pro aminopeptidase